MTRRTRNARSRRNRATLRAAFDMYEAVADPIFVAIAGRTLAANEAARRLARDCSPADIAEALAHVESATLRTEAGDERTYERLTSWMEIVGRGAFVHVLTDRTAMRNVELKLRESEQRYALVAYGANDGLWEWDIATNRIYFSPRWKTMLGHTESEVTDSPSEWFARIHADDLDRVRRHIEADKEDSPNFEVEYRMLHADGSYHWMLTRAIAVRGGDGRLLMMAGSQSDVTEKRDAQEQLVHKAFYDALTDLPNRLLFMDRLRVAVERVKRYPASTFAVLFIDLDRFKVVNDSLGHLVGDKLLVEIARRLEKLLRTTDTFARLGGDEFAIILDGIASPDDATVCAERISKAFAEPFVIGDHTVHSSASIGIALGNQAFACTDDLLRVADLAMYRTKANGRSGYTIYDPEKSGDEADLLYLENDLRSAIERGELELHYQPIVSLAADEIVGFEALLRWNHPTRGLVSPGVFVPIAEETGLIVPIGDWVLQEACRQMREWDERFPDAGAGVTVSVNVSSRQFSQGDLFGSVRRALDRADLDPRRLKIEITESALVGDPARASEILNRLRDLGIELYIDDFGTGYSSLSYIHTFPISGLKIDRSFVARMEDANGKDREIVRSTVSLAHNLGFDVIAEGVETIEQVDRLQRLGCEFAQGWYYSKALDRTRAAKAVAAGLIRRANVLAAGERAPPPAGAR